MMKYKVWVSLGLFLFSCALWSQPGPERVHRIRKSQFPPEALQRLEQNVSGAKRLRFYRETDSAGTRYEARFRKARLHYRVAFGPQGSLEKTAFAIQPADLPSEVWETIGQALDSRLGHHRVLDIRQVYPAAAFDSEAQLFRNTFQNLMLEEILYELSLRTGKAGSRQTLEATFDSSGLLVSLREALPTNYDHVLY